MKHLNTSTKKVQNLQKFGVLADGFVASSECSCDVGASGSAGGGGRAALLPSASQHFVSPRLCDAGSGSDRQERVLCCCVLFWLFLAKTWFFCVSSCASAALLLRSHFALFAASSRRSAHDAGTLVCAAGAGWRLFAPGLRCAFCAFCAESRVGGAGAQRGAGAARRLCAGTRGMVVRTRMVVCLVRAFVFFWGCVFCLIPPRYFGGFGAFFCMVTLYSNSLITEDLSAQIDSLLASQPGIQHV
jgi:hypothetical protein